MSKPLKVLIEGTPTRGESVVVKLENVSYEHTARKTDTAASIAQVLAEKINAGNGNRLSHILAGPIDGGLTLWSKHGWAFHLSASSDDPTLSASVVAG